MAGVTGVAPQSYDFVGAPVAIGSRPLCTDPGLATCWRCL